MGRPRKNQNDPVEIVNKKLEEGKIPTDEEIDACPQGSGKEALKEQLRKQADQQEDPNPVQRSDVAAVRTVLATRANCKYPTLVDYPSVGSLREYRLYNLEFMTMAAAWKAYRQASPTGTYLHFFDILDSELGEVANLYKIVSKMSL